MERLRIITEVVSITCFFVLVGCSPDAAEPPPGAEPGAAEEALAGDPITPIPLDVQLDPRKVALGARLFADPRLSKDGAVTCATCHARSLALADGRARSHAPGRPEAAFNAPTLYNVAYLYKLNWNGKFSSLEDQVGGAMQNPAAMATTWPEALPRLAGDTDYQATFGALYSDGLTAANVADAIAELERSMRTPNAPFDRFLRGDDGAIGEKEKSGWAIFKDYGCISCHQGIGVGGNLLARFGVFREFLEERGGLAERDLGRFAVTGRPEDRFVFRVPSLRNVALTAPYFHDGSAPTLEAAIEVMGRVQLGRDLGLDQVDALVAFLGALTGEPAGGPTP
jgi:cytochrome c peroxidase